MNQNLISFDIRADFGFFKKPDYNDGLLLSYNMLHKPALLGILGAIIGLNGYQQKGKLPAYYERLRDLQIGIEPLEELHEKGNFGKATVKYTNTVGYANLDGTLLIEEMMLLRPGYRCYLMLERENEDHDKLYEYIKAGNAEYIPYLGKNEFSAWWLDETGNSSFREYQFEQKAPSSGPFKIKTLLDKREIILQDNISDDTFFETYNPYEIVISPAMFMYFERLPHHFNEQFMQYELHDMAFSNFPIKEETFLKNLYYLPSQQCYVQLT